MGKSRILNYWVGDGTVLTGYWIDGRRVSAAEYLAFKEGSDATSGKEAG